MPQIKSFDALVSSLREPASTNVPRKRRASEEIAYDAPTIRRRSGRQPKPPEGRADYVNIVEALDAMENTARNHSNQSCTEEDELLSNSGTVQPQRQSEATSSSELVVFQVQDAIQSLETKLRASNERVATQAAQLQHKDEQIAKLTRKVRREVAKAEFEAMLREQIEAERQQDQAIVDAAKKLVEANLGGEWALAGSAMEELVGAVEEQQEYMSSQ